MKLRILDLFAGIGGFSHAFENISSEHFETAAFCEIDPDAQKVLKKHWPKTTIYEDVKTLDSNLFKKLEAQETPANSVDIICGGFP